MGRLFSIAVERRCSPIEKTGITLSGGLDSRAILAAMLRADKQFMPSPSEKKAAMIFALPPGWRPLKGRSIQFMSLTTQVGLMQISQPCGARTVKRAF